MNVIWQMRDRAIDSSLQIPAREILNPLPAHYDLIKKSGPNLGTELKTAVNQFKAAAFNSTGNLVDYGVLRGHSAYQDFRSTLTPRLHFFDPAVLESRDHQIAFWINLYNTLLMDAVIQYRIRETVTEGFVGIVRFFRRAAYQVGGKRVSLEDIEHGILRANRGNPFVPGPHFPTTDPRLAWSIQPLDPRIHFALNCGSRSCPPIGSYSGDELQEQLALAARNFLAQDLSIVPDRNQLKLSMILKWYQDDFGGETGLLNFLQQHLDEDRARWLKQANPPPRIQYSPYDWALNKLSV